MANNNIGESDENKTLFYDHFYFMMIFNSYDIDNFDIYVAPILNPDGYVNKYALPTYIIFRVVYYIILEIRVPKNVRFLDMNTPEQIIDIGVKIEAEILGAVALE